MNNKGNYAYVEVYMDKNDCMLDSLLEDLPEKLFYAGETRTGFICCRGLLKEKEINWLESHISASPYCPGYEVHINGRNMEQYWNWTYVLFHRIGVA